MRGEFIGVWSETRREIWQPLIDDLLLETEEGVPEDIFCELYREMAKALKTQPLTQDLADVIDDPLLSRKEFEAIRSEDIAGEPALVGFFEATYFTLDDLGGDKLTNRYFNLMTAFIEKFSLRYDLRRPCTLCPTLPGIFASLVRDLRVVTNTDPHLDTLMKEFENAVRDLKQDYSDTRIKTCIQKQVNLLEGLGQSCPGVTKDTLGSMCDEIKSWPHNRVKEAMTNLYKFTCNYPGIRHAGTPSAALRPIELRDMVALSILLVGFTPYLCDELNAESVYRGT